MSNDRSKTPFSCCYFIPSSFYQNSPTQQTPYYRQPSVAAASSTSVLFSGFFSRFSSSSSSSSLQINYFVREDEGGKTETKQGGAPCSTSGVVLYNLTFEFLNTSFFWSFFFICINIYSLVFNRYPFAFLRLFYILEKDFVNYCFLCLSKWGSHQEKNIKTNPPPPTSPLLFPSHPTGGDGQPALQQLSISLIISLKLLQLEMIPTPTPKRKIELLNFPRIR